MAVSGPLKLRAHDAEDLRAVAVCLQDALVPLADMTFLRPEKRFVMVANRFKWESRRLDLRAPDDGGRQGDAESDTRFEAAGDAGRERAFYHRINCGICFDRVKRVRSRGLDMGRRDQILNLLTLDAQPGAITLIFSDGGEIRLEVSDIRCHLEDLGEPWPTRWRPSHLEDEPDSMGQS